MANCEQACARASLGQFGSTRVQVFEKKIYSVFYIHTQRQVYTHTLMETITYYQVSQTYEWRSKVHVGWGCTILDSEEWGNYLFHRTRTNTNELLNVGAPVMCQPSQRSLMRVGLKGCRRKANRESGCGSIGREWWSRRKCVKSKTPRGLGQ